MRLSLNWVSEYVEIPDGLQDLCDRLDLTGTGVEGVETLGEALEGVVVGHVLTCEEHPDSDHMHVVTVDVGEAEPVQIVCGAPNIAAGIKVPVAKVGAVLPSEDGGFKIKKSKLRGVVSCGMCCSKRELGRGTDHDGIWVLPEDAPVGVAMSEYLDEGDTVLDLEITPNRPDCLSVTGLARELGAMYLTDVSDPLPEAAARLEQLVDGVPASEDVTVTIADEDRCVRYNARVVEGVKVGPSPAWLAERVTAAGARSINNIADVTNYILFLYGQPLHAFDYDRLKGADGKVDVIIRPAKDGEAFTTLDGQPRELTQDMTVIATPERAVALAGVMGGLDSEVEDDTTCVLLETATFSRAHTSRTSRNLGLISEASLRYERGVDAAPIDEISKAAAALMAEVSGGHVRPGCVEVCLDVPEGRDLDLRIGRFNAMMGSDIPASFMEDVLTRLGCTVQLDGDADVLHVRTPTFRPDLEREIDLYEEVLRLWGMDRIAPTLPASPARVGMRTDAQAVRRTVDATLRACGLSETMTYSFADPEDMVRLRMDEVAPGEAVELLNPMNADHAIMRRSIFPGLLRSVARNQAHGVQNVQLYEIGTVFSTAPERTKPKEVAKVAAVMVGAMGPESWNASRIPFDFFDAKGVCEALTHELACAKMRFKPLEADEAPYVQPGRAARIFSGGIELGWVAELHPLAVEAFDVTGPVAAFELDMAALLKVTRPARDYVGIPSFPAVEVDQAFVVSEDVTHEKMEQVMGSAGGKLLESAALFDVYRDDERVGAGKKSMAYRLIYRASDRTLTTDEVERAHAKLLKKVEAATGAETRS